MLPLEQIQGSGTDARSDLYALAATIYHLATRRVPADAWTRVAAIAGGREDPLPLANAIDPDVPDGIARVLHRAMAHSAGSRFASASDMRSALRQYRAALPPLESKHPHDAAATSTAVEHREAPAVLPVFAADQSVRAEAGALPATELATNAAQHDGAVGPLNRHHCDAALVQLHRRGGRRRRVGLVTGLWWGECVDVTAVDTDFVDHSFHAANRSVISDMFLLITQGLMPSQRPKLRPVGTAPRQFWRFVP